MHRGRGHALADREAEERRVGCDRTPGRRIGDACDGVDHQFAVSIHRDLLAPLDSRFDQLVNGLLNLLLNIGHYRSPPSRAMLLALRAAPAWALLPALRRITARIIVSPSVVGSRARGWSRLKREPCRYWCWHEVVVRHSRNRQTSRPSLNAGQAAILGRPAGISDRHLPLWLQMNKSFIRSFTTTRPSTGRVVLP